jgi:hypothetical protein
VVDLATRAGDVTLDANGDAIRFRVWRFLLEADDLHRRQLSVQDNQLVRTRPNNQRLSPIATIS